MGCFLSISASFHEKEIGIKPGTVQLATRSASRLSYDEALLTAVLVSGDADASGAVGVVLVGDLFMSVLMFVALAEGEPDTESHE